MKRIGIIGVGGIVRAIVGGLCGGVEEPPEIFLSPRGARTATELSQRYPSVRVCADNQDVLDLIEGRLGILDLLDEQCRFPTATYKVGLTHKGRMHLRSDVFMKIHSTRFSRVRIDWPCTQISACMAPVPLGLFKHCCL